MMTNDDRVNRNIQFNLANSQRNAARDYYEYILPGSMKQLLLMSTKEELDRMALNNGYMFKYRFGFIVCQEKITLFRVRL